MDVEQSVALQPVAGSVIRVYTIGFVCLVAESVSSYALFDIDIGIDRAIDFYVPGEGVVGACETTFVGENDNSPDGEVSRSVVEMGAGGILSIGSSHLRSAIAKVPNNTACCRQGHHQNRNSYCRADTARHRWVKNHAIS